MVSYCLDKFGQDVMSAYVSASGEVGDLSLRADLTVSTGSVRQDLKPLIKSTCFFSDIFAAICLLSSYCESC